MHAVPASQLAGLVTWAGTSLWSPQPPPSSSAQLCPQPWSGSSCIPSVFPINPRLQTTSYHPDLQQSVYFPMLEPGLISIVVFTTAWLGGYLRYYWYMLEIKYYYGWLLIPPIKSVKPRANLTFWRSTGWFDTSPLGSVVQYGKFSFHYFRKSRPWYFCFICVWSTILTYA